MKLLVTRLNDFAYKYSGVFQLAVLITIFGFYFVENYVLSESWEVLSLRSIDDYAIQDSVHSMQKAILAGNWVRVFGTFDYAYGDAFWLLNSVLLLPLYFIGDAQTLIVVGRQISLICVFSSIYVIGLIIDRLWPDARSLKYPVLISIASMPMVAIISTKFHVNAQSLLLGILAFYFIVRDTRISRSSMLLSAVLAGMAVGFKLTGIIIAPLLLITLVNRLHEQGNENVIGDIALYISVFVVITAGCTAPGLILFPFYINELGTTYKTFLIFKNMTSADVQVSISLIVDTLRYYFSPLYTLALFSLFIPLVFADIKKNKYISFYIFMAILFALLLVFAVVHKGPIYIATYFINLAFFVPLGLIGIGSIKIVPYKLRALLAYFIVAAGIAHGWDHREKILASYDYFAKVKDEKIQNQLLALDEIRRLIYPLKLPVRILQDSSSIFPATRFIDGVDVAINYGDLKEKSTWGKFDYILLNSDTYYGKRINSTTTNRESSKGMQSIENLEESTRKTLREKGLFYGRKYKLIYSGYDALLYKLEAE